MNLRNGRKRDIQPWGTADGGLPGLGHFGSNAKWQLHCHLCGWHVQIVPGNAQPLKVIFAGLGVWTRRLCVNEDLVCALSARKHVQRVRIFRECYDCIINYRASDQRPKAGRVVANQPATHNSRTSIQAASEHPLNYHGISPTWLLYLLGQNSRPPGPPPACMVAD
jgi:hypothetical protein